MGASILAHGLILIMSTAHAAVVGTTNTPSVATNSGAPDCTTTLGPIPSPPSTVTWGPGRICEGLTGKTPHCCNGNNECRTNVTGKCGDRFMCCWALADPTNLGIGCEDVPKICHAT